MADETFEIGLAVEGDASVVQSLGRVQAAQRGVTQQGNTQAAAARTQATQIVAAQQQIGASAVTTGQRFGQLSSAAGNVGAVFAQVSPQLGHVGSLFSAVGSSATALTGAMGPVGVAVGVVTAAVGIGTTAWSAYQAHMEDAANASADAATTLEESAARIQSAMDESARGQRASEEAFLRAELQRAQSVRVQTVGQLRAAENSGNTNLANRNADLLTTADRALHRAQEALDENLRAAAQESARAEGRRAEEEEYARFHAEQVRIERNQQAQLGEQEDELEDRRNAHRNAARDGARAIAAAEREVTAALREQGAMRAGFAAVAQQQAVELAAQQDQLNAYHQFWADLDNETTDRVIANRDRIRAKEAASADAAREKNIEIANEAKRHQEEVGQITESMWSDIGSTVTDAAGQMFKFVQEGGDLGSQAFLGMLDSFLEATAFQYTIKALAEAAEAVAAAARYDYAAAAQHGVAAAMAGAVATATGIAGLAIQVPSAGSASASSSTPAPVTGQTGTGGGNITVQLFAPQAVFTEAERGQLLASGIREARRQLGPGSVRP